MSRKILSLIVFLVIFACLWAVAGTQRIKAQDPTIPTRTPTPDPNQPSPVAPTATEDAGEPGNPPPGPTDSSEPSSTAASASATPVGAGIGTVTATPSGGAGSAQGTGTPPVLLGGTFQPNSQGIGGCTDTPYVQAIRRAIVYGGPGIDFGPVATLQMDEMRPIIGRAQYGPWWQILVDSNFIGWVHDDDVKEYGNTALVPVVDPPLLNGATPTPGTPWNPTPLPLLTCVPTPTPSPTPTSTATEALAGAGSSGTSTGAGESAEETTLSTTGAPTAEMVMAELDATAVALGVVDNTTVEENIAQGSSVNPRGSDASRTASPTSATNLILPLAGIALIAGGIVLALVSRKREDPAPGESK